jgi:hypothetical protein
MKNARRCGWRRSRRPTATASSDRLASTDAHGGEPASASARARARRLWGAAGSQAGHADRNECGQKAGEPTCDRAHQRGADCALFERLPAVTKPLVAERTQGRAQHRPRRSLALGAVSTGVTHRIAAMLA